MSGGPMSPGMDDVLRSPEEINDIVTEQPVRV